MEKDYSFICYKLIVILLLVSVLRFVSDRSCIEKYTSSSIIYSDSRSEIKTDELILSLQGVSKIPKSIQVAKASSTEESKNVSKSVGRSIGKKSDRKLIENSVGWIKIPGIVIDYPVMYNEDNNYYLNHSKSGEKSKEGSIFLDASSSGVWGKVNLVNGHNMRTGAMFGELSKYTDQSWGTSHKYAWLTEGDTEYKYTLFSVYHIDGNNETVTVGCDSDEEYPALYHQMAARSMYKLETPPDDATVLILNTCSYGFDGEHLLVCFYRN